MQHKKAISILVDNDSWILPYATDLEAQLREAGNDARLVRKAEDIPESWANFMLGCTRLVKPAILARSKYNLVVHESDLPKGRGFAPVAWQILEGMHDIPMHLIEAAEEADAGRIWLSRTLSLNGTELCAEWRHLQGMATIDLCRDFVLRHDELSPREQAGEPSFYPRRKPADSALSVDKTIAEQFDLLRVVDNERYPAFFHYRGKRYVLSVREEEESGT